MVTAAGEARTVLLLEDNSCDAKLIERALADATQICWRVEHVTQLSCAVERLQQGGVDAAVVDLSILDSSGPTAIQTLLATVPALPLIVVAGVEQEQLAIDLLQRGVQDYLLKQDIEPKLLARTIRYAIERSRVAALESCNHRLEVANAALAEAVEKLKDANEDLAQFPYFASHDLQEPVRKISYFAAQLKEDLGDGLSNEARADFYYLANAAHRMQALIRSLLVLCNAGHAEMERGPVDLETCVNDALECLSDKIQAAKAVIKRQPLPEVKGDPTLLTHLYQNLIGNALKFNKEQPPEIDLTAERQGVHYLLGVRDNGIGIECKFAETIFAPFRRLHSRDQYEGAGIGLAICKKVVDRHGGRIWVESQPGAGACFRFLLPQYQERGGRLPVRPLQPSECLAG